MSEKIEVLVVQAEIGSDGKVTHRKLCAWKFERNAMEAALIGAQSTSVGHSVSHAQPRFVLILRHARPSERPFGKLWGNQPLLRAGMVVSWG